MVDDADGLASCSPFRGGGERFLPDPADHLGSIPRDAMCATRCCASAAAWRPSRQPRQRRFSAPCPRLATTLPAPKAATRFFGMEALHGAH
jgi:hypothetical protein